MRPHLHEAYELNCVVAGRGRYRFADREIEIETGELVWIPPGAPHQLVSPREGLTLVVVKLLRLLTERIAGQDGFSLPRQPSPVAVGLPEDRLKTFLSVAGGLQDGATASANRGLAYLLSVTFDLLEPSPAPAMASLVTGVRELLDEDPSRFPNGAGVAQRFGMSYRTLARALAASGTTLRALWREAALRQFEVRYQRHGNMLRACLEAGFGSYSQFYRVFVAAHGAPPRAYLQGRASREQSPARRAAHG